jgi:hypothetical protein
MCVAAGGGSTSRPLHGLRPLVSPHTPAVYMSKHVYIYVYMCVCVCVCVCVFVCVCVCVFGC